MSLAEFYRRNIANSKILAVAKIGKAIKTFINLVLHSRLVYNIRFHPRQDDKQYIIRTYRDCFGYEPNLDAPRNFNEKNNWRKLYDRREIYTLMVDKYKVKEIIAKRVGIEHTFPLLGVWKSPNDIDFNQLPDQFVLKVNHAGGVIVCREKNHFDRAKAIKELQKQLEDDYYIYSREWPYKNVERRVIAEQYMGENLTDFKNYCFNGKLQYTFVWENKSRADGRKPDAFFCGAYDTDWIKSGIEIGYPSKEKQVEKPTCYDEMLRIAESMSEGIPFVRVDCYIIDNHVYVGEMTFFPWGGFMKFKDEKWNNLLGDLEQLPEKMNS